jgi:SAM-dependent methyltransferase
MRPPEQLCQSLRGYPIPDSFWEWRKSSLSTPTRRKRWPPPPTPTRQPCLLAGHEGLSHGAARSAQRPQGTIPASLRAFKGTGRYDAAELRADSGSFGASRSGAGSSWAGRARIRALRLAPLAQPWSRGDSARQSPPAADGPRRRVRRARADVAAVRAEYERRRQEFTDTTARLGLTDLARYYWYHTIDLGNGLVTPGDYDYRSVLPRFGFPVDMRGRRVLDVGSATGFFAFEFERRGAEVVSVGLPSITDWDMVAGDRAALLDGLKAQHRLDSLEEIQRFHFRRPLRFLSRAAGLAHSTVHSTVYELRADRLGGAPFDLVFLGDVLQHLFWPLGALAAVAPLCPGTLAISQQVPYTLTTQPVMWYTGGAEPKTDRRSR